MSIYVYDPAETVENIRRGNRATICFQATPYRIGSRDEYRFFRSFDLLNGATSTTKLFFQSVEDYIHYMALRSFDHRQHFAQSFTNHLEVTRQRMGPVSWDRHFHVFAL